MIAPAQSDVPKLALSAAEAAEALSVSERHLNSLVAADKVPHARLGHRVVFPVNVLEEWFRHLNERFLPAPQAAAPDAKEAY